MGLHASEGRQGQAVRAAPRAASPSTLQAQGQSPFPEPPPRSAAGLQGPPCSSVPRAQWCIHSGSASPVSPKAKQGALPACLTHTQHHVSKLTPKS